MHDEDSISGIVSVGDVCSSPRWSDISPVSESRFCVLLRGRRYGRWWLLKGLRAEFATSEMHRVMLRKEFNTLIMMQHPNIVSAVEITSLSGTAYCGEFIVMEWIEGNNLGEWLKTVHSRHEKLHVLAQLLEAVDFCHSLGVVHRDIKPANIMLTRNGNRVKLIDFGLADADSYAILKQPAGTPGYMSPEQQATAEADVRNDVFSLGQVMRVLRLGPCYRRVIARATSPIGSRYADVAQLRHAVVNAKRRCRLCGRLTALLIATIAAVILFVTVKTEEPIAPTPVADADTTLTAPPADILSAAATQAPEVQAPAERIGTARPASNTPVHRQYTDSALRLLLHSYVEAASEIDRLVDSMSRDSSFTIDSKRLSYPSKAWKDAYYTRFKGMSDSDINFDSIYFVLERHHAERYAIWNRRIQEINDKRETK